MLNDENNVSKKRVKSVFRITKNVVISAGLSAGDRVVTDGIGSAADGRQNEVVEPQTTMADEKSPSRHEGRASARLMQVYSPGSTGASRSVYSAPRALPLADGGDFTRRGLSAIASRLVAACRRGQTLPHYSGCYALLTRQPDVLTSPPSPRRLSASVWPDVRLKQMSSQSSAAHRW